MDNQIQDEQQDIVNTPIQNMVADTQKDSTVGPLIGSIVIILIVIVGGLYFWGALITNKKAEIRNTDLLEEQADALEIEQAAQQSTSTDIGSIEADLNATNVDGLDGDISDIDQVL